jgi:type IV pilus assembly protein PilW
MKAARLARGMRGVTLIELLISMVIGMVVVAAVLVSFVDSGKVSRYQATLGQMNLDAQVALNLLSREVQLAGYVSPVQSLGSTPPLFGCDGTVGSVPFTNPAATGALSCGAATGTTVSALEVVYEADLYNTVVAAGSVPSDCLGNGFAVGATPYIVRNRYFIDTGPAGRPELYCASNLSAKQPLLENVDQLQIWYGIVAAAAPNQVIRYAQAGKDATTPGTVNAQAAGEWNNVMSVKICLLMRSAEPILTGEDTLTYQDCGATTQTSADKYLRRAFFTTATVRAKMTS